jgi:hypothetical protein
VSWIYALLFLAAALAVYRVYGAIRRMRSQRDDDWDEQLVKNLRAQGGDAFRPYVIDFFFGAPDQAACERIAAALQADGCEVDFRPAESEGATGYTLHAGKQLRVSVPEMQAHSTRYRQLARANASSYDGWATAGVTRKAEDGKRLRPMGVPRRQPRKPA